MISDPWAYFQFVLILKELFHQFQLHFAPAHVDGGLHPTSFLNMFYDTKKGPLYAYQITCVT